MNRGKGDAAGLDLPTQRPSDCDHHMAAPYDREAHRASLLRGTPLAELLGKEEMGMNSCHHQAVRDLAPQLAPMALAPDGVTEAVYMPGKRFVWGVQWHPEFSLLAVEGRGHVVAAGEEDAIASLQQPPDVRAILRQGQHHPQPAGLGDGVHIPGQHPQAVPPGVHQGDNADDRLLHASSLLILNIPADPPL